MSKELVTNQTQVYSFMEMSLKNQREQVGAMEMLLQNMLGVEKRVDEKLVKVEKVESRIEELAKELRDENRLLPAEIDDLFMSVVAKSTELAKIRHKEEDEKFTRIVGKYRKNIWSKLKKKFGVSKYIHIKRIDYQPAMDFVNGFDPEDYL